MAAFHNGKGQMARAVPPQGYLTLKSSPFNAVAGKLMTQNLVVNHMNHHYRKLVQAKSAIDTGLPASYLHSQKVRDRRRREAVLRGEVPPSPSRRGSSLGALPYSDSCSSEAGQLDAVKDVDNEEDYGLYEEDTAVVADNYSRFERQQAQQELELAEYKRDLAAGELAVRQQSCVESWVPRSARSLSTMEGSRASKTRVSKGQQLALAKDTAARKTMSADILDKRQHKFTEPEGDFTPRTLKKEVPSRLSSYKYYNPPKRVGGGGEAKGRTTRGSAEAVESSGAVHGNGGQADVESAMMDETLVSRDFSRTGVTGGGVPPLDISLDTDHIRWLKEHSRVEGLKTVPLPRAKLSTVEGSNSSIGSIGGARATLTSEEQRWQPQATATFTRAAPRQAAMRRVSATSSTQERISMEEEELKYLNFVTEVTNDILTRGVFSDRVLQQVFEEHIRKRRNELLETRMRALLETLRDDLGIASPPLPLLSAAETSTAFTSSNTRVDVRQSRPVTARTLQLGRESEVAENGTSKTAVVGTNSYTMPTSTVIAAEAATLVPPVDSVQEPHSYDNHDDSAQYTDLSDDEELASGAAVLQVRAAAPVAAARLRHQSSDDSISEPRKVPQAATENNTTSNMAEEETSVKSPVSDSFVSDFEPLESDEESSQSTHSHGNSAT